MICPDSEISISFLYMLRLFHFEKLFLEAHVPSIILI